MGDTLLLHWQPVASNEAPHTLELRVPNYVAETPSEWHVITPVGCDRIKTASGITIRGVTLQCLLPVL